jgi:hypothetical protein
LFLFFSKADVGGCSGEFANVVDGDIHLGDTLGDDSIILIPVDLAGMSDDIGSAGDFNCFVGCSFRCFIPDSFRLADDEETFCITWKQIVNCRTQIPITVRTQITITEYKW